MFSYAFVSFHNLHLVLLNSPKIFGKTFYQIFGQGFDQGLGEGKNHKYCAQFYPAYGKKPIKALTYDRRNL